MMTSMTPKRSGVALVISAPSGAGKTTLCRSLAAEMAHVAFSVSHTTRPPRPGEQDGVDYHFVDEARFTAMVGEGQFLEWASVHGHRYGTSRAWVEARLAAGTDVLFDIDVQGGRQIAERLAGAVLVYVVPPDFPTLELRLRRRASDSEEQVQRRLAAAAAEMNDGLFYGYWIVNRDITDAVADIRSILRAERLRRVDKRQILEGLLGRYQSA